MRRVAVTLLLLPVLTVSCSGGNAASQLAQPPAFAPEDQTKCGVTKSQARPLIVEWPSADRGDLEAQAKRGLVAVRYEGCEMELLRRCRAPGAYGYTALTRKDDRITIRDADELYANVPLGAARLEGKLEKAGELDVSMTIVGKYDADKATVRRDELEGDCAAATHVVTSLTAGAFEFFAGADAELGGGATALGAGAGGKSTAKRELLNRDGDMATCKPTSEDRKPPEGCGALLRVEVVPLGEAPIACPAGTKLDAGKCVASVPAATAAPSGAAPPAPAEASALRVLCTVPDAEVRIDGRALGPCPVDVKHLQLGQHLIDVRAAGYRSFSTRVAVRAGEALTVRAELQRE